MQFARHGFALLFAHAHDVCGEIAQLLLGFAHVELGTLLTRNVADDAIPKHAAGGERTRRRSELQPLRGDHSEGLPPALAPLQKSYQPAARGK